MVFAKNYLKETSSNKVIRDKHFFNDSVSKATAEIINHKTKPL